MVVLSAVAMVVLGVLVVMLGVSGVVLVTRVVSE